MRLIFIVAALFIGIAFARPEEFHESPEDFEKEYGILYNDKKEEAIEAENLKKAEDQINENNKNFEMGKSTFEEKLYPDSNLPKDEFEKEKEGAKIPSDVRYAALGRGLGAIMPPESERNDPENAARLAELYAGLDRAATPASYDARTAGLVTNPKSQGQCGSCAAFAATGLHETCMLKAGASLNGLDLSEQYLIDCGYDGNSMNACDGAWVHAYTEWFKNDGGVSPHESKYPYLDRSPRLTCTVANGVDKWNSGAKVTSGAWDFSCNADTMKSLVSSQGAVMGALHVDSGFQNYASGVYQGCTSKEINHAVLIVGYGTENGVDYWLVKNSWGENWGGQGYIKVKRGTNECGIEGACITATCATNGSADAAPPATTPAPVESKPSCNISSLFGNPYITGRYNLRVTSNTGQEYNSYVDCTNSVCRPVNPGPSNACVYICGSTTC